MSLLLLGLETVTAVFAVLFIVYYARILYRAQEAGPEPVSWIIAAVGLSLIAAFAVLETVMTFRPGELVVNIQRVYFMTGNIIIASVLYMVWRTVSGKHGW